MLEKKRNMSDEHVRTIPIDRQNNRKFNGEEEVIKNFSHSLPYAPFFPPQISAQGSNQEANSSYPQSNKRKRTKMYHSLSMSYAKLLPILIQNYQISIIPAKPKKSSYPKWYDPSATYKYHDGIEQHSIKNCMTFKGKVQALINAYPAKFKQHKGNRIGWGLFISLVLILFSLLHTLFGKVDFVLT